ncbi:MAG TPA: hypothetical protein VGM03_00105 [Phycisphaerae bacterium]
MAAPITCSAMWNRAAILCVSVWCCSAAWGQATHKGKPASRPATTSVPAGDPCAEFRNFQQESDPAKHDKLVKRLFRCLWNRTDDLERREAELARRRDTLSVQGKSLSKNANERERAEWDTQLKQMDEKLDGVRASLADTMAERQALIDAYPRLLLPLQMDELLAKEGDLNTEIDFADESIQKLERARRAAAAQRPPPAGDELQRMQAELEKLKLEAHRLRAKRTECTRERFRTKEKLDALPPPE